MGTSGEATGLNLLPASDAGLGTLEGRLVRNAESASGCWVHSLFRPALAREIVVRPGTWLGRETCAYSDSFFKTGPIFGLKPS